MQNKSMHQGRHGSRPFGTNRTRQESPLSKVRKYAITTAIGVATALAFAPLAANAIGHTCVSGDVCFYNNASFNADPPNGLGVTNPWSAISGNYYNMHNWPEPHTYNNPDVCNNTHALFAICNINDSVSAAKNKSTQKNVRLYTDAGYSGNYQTILRGSSTTQVTYNDQTSSIYWS